MRSVLKNTLKGGVGLVNQNIPYLQKVTNFSRGEIYKFFVLFKTLSAITTQKLKKEKRGKKILLKLKFFINIFIYFYKYWIIMSSCFKKIKIIELLYLFDLNILN